MSFIYQQGIISMIRQQRQASFSTEKTQMNESKEDRLFRAKSKNPTNPSIRDKQLTQQLILHKSDQTHLQLPIYRVNRLKIEKNKLRLSDNSALKQREKTFIMSPYKHQQFEAYNFSHIRPSELPTKKKGRAYFYRINKQREELEEEPTALQADQEQQKAQRVLGEEEGVGVGEVVLQQMHYEMVRTLQKCKRMTNFDA